MMILMPKPTTCRLPRRWLRRWRGAGSHALHSVTLSHLSDVGPRLAGAAGAVQAELLCISTDVFLTDEGSLALAAAVAARVAGGALTLKAFSAPAYV